jgi:hypothetical protein
VLLGEERLQGDLGFHERSDLVEFVADRVIKLEIESLKDRAEAEVWV